MRSLRPLPLLAALLAAGAAEPARAGLVGSEVNSGAAPSYGLQPRPTQLSVCFYGDALTSRADRVKAITDALRNNTEAAANLRFTGFGTCQAPTTGTCGSGAQAHSCDQYPGDIRIALDGTQIGGVAVTRQIPASFTDCSDHGAWSSWSQFPAWVDQPDHRACPYNAAVGDDADTSVSPPVRWLNHPLHEVGGHAMGFAHEFLQSGYYNFVGPNGSICANSTTPPPSGYRGLTPVDAYSVMMYQELSCGIHGNYSQSGYSEWDRLSLHILYPETARVAEYVGTTVVKTGQAVALTSTWQARGAVMANVATQLAWSIGGVSASGGTFSASYATPGARTGTFTFNDFLGRSFSAPIEVRVMSPADFDGKIAGPIAAQLGWQ